MKMLTFGGLRWVSLSFCSTRLTVSPLVQFRGAGSFFRPSDIFLLFPHGDSRLHISGRVVRLPARVAYARELLFAWVRITPVFCGCLPFSQETQNSIVIHCATPGLRDDDLTELCGDILPTIAYLFFLSMVWRAL